MQKLFIKNRKRQNMAVIVEENENPKGLVFVMHGLGGFKEQPHVKTFAKAFLDSKFTVIRFDTTNTFGESDGSYANATFTNYYEDLEDMIAWAETQTWYQEPFWLSGHSLGGMCTSLYSQKYPKKVRALAPIATTISGELLLKTPEYANTEEMKERGWIKERRGIKLKWSHIEDRAKYNILPEADKLTMPVLMIVGELDDGSPLKHQQLLFDKLPGKKELHIIKGAPHTFKDRKHLQEIKEIFLKWIDRVTHNS